MARTVTLAQLRTDARLWADQRPGGSGTFVSDTELTRIVNLEIAKVYDLLVAARGQEYYIANVVVTRGTAAQGQGTAYSPAITDFYEMVAMYDVTNAPRTEELREYTWDTLPALYGMSYGLGTPKGYRLLGSILFIYPDPPAGRQFSMFYVPAFTFLASDSDTWDGVNGWESLVTLGAAMKLRAIEEMDYGDLAAMYQEELARITKMAAEKTPREPAMIRDVQPEGALRRWVEMLPRP